jgi:hypothetical protein
MADSSILLSVMYAGNTADIDDRLSARKHASHHHGGIGLIGSSRCGGFRALQVREQLYCGVPCATIADALKAGCEKIEIMIRLCIAKGWPEPIPALLCAQARQRPSQCVLTDDLAHAQDLWAGPVTA